MIKFNYNEPEFKVIVSASEDVITTSLEVADQTWDTGTGGNELDFPLE